ncbi:MAG: transposase, partial [Lachnospiraceae bacterium]
NYPDIPLLLRGDSGFTKPKLYEQCETNGISYVIRLKASQPLYKLSSYIDDNLTDATKNDVYP